MNFRLYAARHAWLIVPDCMQASQAAVERFGPLEFMREVEQRELGAGDTARILGEIDASSFAVVPDHLAQRLLRARVGEHA